MTHEVGHWLNLFHIFEGTCDGVGDGVDDTPPSRMNRKCVKDIDSCPDEAGLDLVENFMGYTDDACRNAFTDGQFTMMKAAWYRHRHNGPKEPTALPTNAPSALGDTTAPTRWYVGKPFTSFSELKNNYKVTALIHMHMTIVIMGKLSILLHLLSFIYLIFQQAHNEAVFDGVWTYVDFYKTKGL